MRYALLSLADGPAVASVRDDGGYIVLKRVFHDAPTTTWQAAADPTLAARIATLPLRDDFLAPADTPLLAPIPRPNRILAIGRNYAEHARELGNAVPEEPVVFLKASTCVVGPGVAIECPTWVGRIDYEGELLVVLSDGGRDIAEDEALAKVCGYTVFNDVTAREKSKALQGKGHPWFLAKSMDTFGPMGPYLVTADEVPDPSALRVRLSVNGDVKQDGATSDMIHSIPKLIAFLSKWMALEPGDVIATGTPPGVGPIVPGDTVTVSIDGVGELTNTVVAR